MATHASCLTARVADGGLICLSVSGGAQTLLAPDDFLFYCSNTPEALTIIVNDHRSMPVLGVLRHARRIGLIELIVTNHATGAVATWDDLDDVLLDVINGAEWPDGFYPDVFVVVSPGETAEEAIGAAARSDVAKHMFDIFRPDWCVGVSTFRNLLGQFRRMRR